MSTEHMATLLPLEVKEREAAVRKIGVDMGYTTAQTDRILALLPSDVQINEGKVMQIGKDLEKTDAIIAQMAQENEQIAANTELLKGRVGKLAIETDILSKLGEEEMKAKIEQLTTSAELTRKRSEALAAEIPFIGEKARAEIDLLNQFGAAEKQAALDLIESKILANGSYSDLEEFQVAIMAENKRLEDQLATESDAGIISELEAQIARNKSRIGAATVALADTAVELSKGQAPTVFAHISKQTLQGYNLTQEYSSLDQIISNIDEGEYPKYFKAVIEANDIFSSVYGGSAQGSRYADAKINAVNRQLEDFAGREPNRFKGKFNSLDELSGSQIAFNEGDIVSYKDEFGQDIFAIYSGGEMVRAVRAAYED